MKTKYNAIFFIVLLSTWISIFLINSTHWRAENIISDWDNDIEGWKEEDPQNFAEITAKQKRMKIEYNWRDVNNDDDWFTVKKIFTFNRNWSLYEGVAFSIVSDRSSDTKFRVIIKDDNEWWVTGNIEHELYSLNHTGRRFVIINFNKFKPDAFTSPGDNYLNLNSIQEIGFNFWDSKKQKGVVYFDELQLVHFQWWQENLLIIFGIVSIDVTVAVFLIVYIFNIKEARRKVQNILKVFKRS